MTSPLSGLSLSEVTKPLLAGIENKFSNDWPHGVDLVAALWACHKISQVSVDRIYFG
jgi:hypothetical protein